jgi:long-chain acyl-CoA synthetase
VLSAVRRARKLVSEPVVDVVDSDFGRTAIGRPQGPVPTTGSLADIPFDNAAAAPDAVVVRRKVDDAWVDVTAARLCDEVLALARGLVARGLVPGARVGLMANTSYEWMLFDLAIWAAGGVVVPIYPTSSVEQAQWILKDAGAVACVTEDAGHTRVVAASGAGVPTWCIADGVVDTLSADGAAVPAGEVERRRADLSPGSTATLIYTSGTTGRPKGCVITHGNLLVSIDGVNAILLPPYRAMSSVPPSTLLFLPLAHSLGRTVQLACLRARILLGHWPSVQPAELRPELAAFRPTFLVGVPYLWEKIRDNGRAQAQDMGKAGAFDRAMRIAMRSGRLATEDDPTGGPGRLTLAGLRLAHRLYDLLVYRRIRAALGGSISYGISGGSALSADLVHFFTGAGISLYEGYGLTETCAAITVNPPLRPRPGTVGRPIPAAEIRVGPTGEIQARGPMVFQGYHNRSDGLDPDGWFHTGDLGSLDDDGYLSITGRAKEILVTSNGKNVSPVLLEDRLRSHPLVGQAVVVGDGRPFVTALLTVDPDAAEHWGKHAPDPSDAGLRSALQEAVDQANAAVSRAESIRAFAIVPDAFSEENGLLTPTLKLRRKRVLDRYADEIDRLYARAR